MAAIASVRFSRGDLSGLLAKVGSGLYDGVSQAADLIKQEAQTLCPVDTGALQASIEANVYRGIQNITGSGGSIGDSMFSVSARVAPGMYYAAYVEFGTGIRGAASAGAGPGPYKPDWPGMAAQPYMRPALDNQRANAESTIASAVRNALT